MQREQAMGRGKEHTRGTKSGLCRVRQERAREQSGLHRQGPVGLQRRLDLLLWTVGDLEWDMTQPHVSRKKSLCLPWEKVLEAGLDAYRGKLLQKPRQGTTVGEKLDLINRFQVGWKGFGSC